MLMKIFYSSATPRIRPREKDQDEYKRRSSFQSRLSGAHQNDEQEKQEACRRRVSGETYGDLLGRRSADY